MPYNVHQLPWTLLGGFLITLPIACVEATVYMFNRE